MWAAGISWLGVQPGPWSPCPLREGRVWRSRGMAAGSGPQRGSFWKRGEGPASGAEKGGGGPGRPEGKGEKGFSPRGWEGRKARMHTPRAAAANEPFVQACG